MPLFDLKKNLIFYGAYHRDPTNVAIHIACVPMLLATALIFVRPPLHTLSRILLADCPQGSNTPSIALGPSRLTALLSQYSLPLNFGTTLALTYSTLYLILSPNIAGLSSGPLMIGVASLANRLTSTYNRSKVNTVAIALHLVSWIAQFVGHGKYEGRKPALVDNIAQALFLAPLFVWYEVLFKLGFYKRLQKEVEVGIEEEVRKIKGKGKAA
jgi:uncharacterized membrane protein YGL010W